MTPSLVSCNCKESDSCCTEGSVADAQQAVIENILTRMSVRSYTDQKVEAGKIDTLLRAAMAAPSAVNKQPWRFVVIDERAKLDSIAANFPSMKMAGKAPLAIVLCGDMEATLEGVGRDYWVQDVSAATENLLLAAHGIGLGAVWCGVYPTDRVDGFRSLLNLPETIVPLACVVIGYPAGDNQPKDKWKPENVHYNTWGNQSSAE